MDNFQHDRTWLDRPVHSHIPWLSNEIVIFILVILAAIITRLYGLGDRVMSHDESLHTYFSWLLSKGDGYQHNPMMHGPLQFHLLALTYFIFGTNDFIARLPHALSSIATVILLWKWRRYLGRSGTLITALLVVISPYLLYYGRYARNEAFVGLVGLLVLYSILRYFETGNKRYIFMVTLATALHFTIKETAFIYTAQALLFLACYFLVRVTRSSWRNPALFRAFLGTLITGLILIAAVFGARYFGGIDATNAGQTIGAQGTDVLIDQLSEPRPGFPFVEVFVAGAAFFMVAAGIFMIFGCGWENIRKERSFDLLIILGTFVLPQLVAFPIKFIGSIVDPMNGWNPLDYTFQTTLTLSAAIQSGTLSAYFKEFFSQGIVHTALVLIPVVAISILIGIWWDKKIWLLNAAIWYIVFTLFYTTFFTNGQGFFTGMVGSLGYWLEQQGVNRGSQPWYYYLLIQIPIYEFLPAIGIWLALIFGIRRRSPAPLPLSEHDPIPTVSEIESPASEGNHTFGILFWWSLSSLLAFTIAGEKMPWLTYHITLPMILLSGWALGQVVERLGWKQVSSKHGGMLVGLFVIFLIALGAILVSILGGSPPFQGKELTQLSATASFIFSLTALLGSGVAILYILLKDRWEPKNFLRLVMIGIFGILAILTCRAAVRATYISYDDGTEYLVYAHGARGINDIMTQVKEISRRTEGESNIIVAYDVSAPDTGVSWPFTWYLRDYPNTRPFDQPTKSLREASIIIVDQKNFEKILPVVGDAYYSFDYLRMVWPNQDYFGLTWDRIRADISNPDLRAGIFYIWLNRDYTLYATAKADASNNVYFNQSAYQIAGWEPSDKMRLYIRKDIAAQIWEYGVGPSTATVQVDPYEAGLVSMNPNTVIGSYGQGDGQLNNPRGITTAPDGSIFIADTNNNRIVHFSSSGEFLNSWGRYGDISTGPATLDVLNQPWGIAASADGKWLYVTDTWNHRVVKLSTNGKPITSWGFGQYGGDDPYGLWGPRGIAVDISGNVYITDTGNKRVIAYSPNGVYLGQIGSEGMSLGEFSEPVGITFDPIGNLYIADTWNQRIQVFSTYILENGTANFISLDLWDVSAWYGQSLDNKPYLTADSQGNIFATDPETGHVYMFTSTGDYLRGWGGIGTSSDPIGIAAGIAINDGNIFVIDSLNSRVLRFSLP